MKIYKTVDPHNTRFDYIKLDKGKYKYKLARNYSIQLGFEIIGAINTGYYSLTDFGRLMIKSSYAWDGASGPTIDSKCTVRASCVHDALYQMIREDELGAMYKDYADKLLKQMIIEDYKATNSLSLMWINLRASYYYYAVKLFGRFALK